MYVDITVFFADADPFDFSHSRAEGGADAGPETWAAALAEAAERPPLTTAGQLAALREHVRGFGAWEPDEIAAWSDVECNALFIQLVSGDMREGGLDQAGYDFDGPEWRTYCYNAEEGKIAGNIHVEGDDKVFYYLGD